MPAVRKKKKSGKTEQNQTESRLYPDLSLEQEKAVILIVEGHSATDTAKKLRISRSTLYEWKAQKAFKEAYEREERKVISEMRGMSLNLQVEAFASIRAALRSTKVSPLEKARLGLKYLADTDNLQRYKTQFELNEDSQKAITEFFTIINDQIDGLVDSRSKELLKNGHHPDHLKEELHWKLQEGELDQGVV
ncbi:MAG: helix-turn-helix domain-containing protein [Leptospiraceae bacterium]|nr:helix-turn-helix domain-containing protein [Leptospiraceae bacterium]